jgi:hypothetical protein
VRNLYELNFHGRNFSPLIFTIIVVESEREKTKNENTHGNEIVIVESEREERMKEINFIAKKALCIHIERKAKKEKVLAFDK